MRQVNFLVITPDNFLREEILALLAPPYHKVEFAEKLDILFEKDEDLNHYQYIIVDEMSGWIPDSVIQKHPQVSFIFLDGFARFYSRKWPNFRTISKISLMSTLNHFRYGLVERSFSA